MILVAVALMWILVIGGIVYRFVWLIRGYKRHSKYKSDLIYKIRNKDD